MAKDAIVLKNEEKRFSRSHAIGPIVLIGAGWSDIGLNFCMLIPRLALRYFNFAVESVHDERDQHIESKVDSHRDKHDFDGLAGLIE